MTTQSQAVAEANSKRGRFKSNLKDSPIVQIWRNMMSRCYNENNIRYHSYGGRGIAVHPDWHDAAQFIADMGNRPEGMTVERIDNNADYSKTNCRWATRKEQGLNRNTTRFLSAYGETLCLKHWAIKLGCEPKTIRWYLNKGKSMEEIVDYQNARRNRK